MRVVADVNSFLAVALSEPARDRLIQLTGGTDLVSPRAVRYEIGNALSRMARKGRLDRSGMQSVWQITLAIPVELVDVDFEAALTIVAEHGIYAYDAYYLECAASLKCPLLTLDRTMKRVARTMGLPLLEL